MHAELRNSASMHAFLWWFLLGFGGDTKLLFGDQAIDNRKIYWLTSQK